MHSILSHVINMVSELKSLGSPLTSQLLNKIKSTEAFREIAHDGWRIRLLEEIAGDELKKRLLAPRSPVADSLYASYYGKKRDDSGQSQTFWLTNEPECKIEDAIHEELSYLIMDVFNVVEKDTLNRHRKGKVARFVFRKDDFRPIFVTLGPWSE